MLQKGVEGAERELRSSWMPGTKEGLLTHRDLDCQRPSGLGSTNHQARGPWTSYILEAQFPHL